MRDADALLGDVDPENDEIGPSERRRAEQIERAWASHQAPPRQITNYRREWRLKRYEMQNGLCAYCGCRLIPDPDMEEGEQPQALTLDHVVPLAGGGLDEFHNTLASCLACNRAKADLSLEQWRRHPARRDHIARVNTPPDRLSLEPDSPWYDPAALDRGVGIVFRGQERVGVYEYCVSENWIRVAAPKGRRRDGRPLLIKLTGPVQPRYEALSPDPMAAADDAP